MIKPIGGSIEELAARLGENLGRGDSAGPILVIACKLEDIATGVLKHTVIMTGACTADDTAKMCGRIAGVATKCLNSLKIADPANSTSLDAAFTAAMKAVKLADRPANTEGQEEQTGADGA